MDPHNGFYEFSKMTLTLTTACTLRCKMCEVWHLPKETLGRDAAFQIADFARRRGFREVEVTGGEPTLAPYFYDLVDRLCDGIPDVRVSTNGYYTLKDDEVQRLASHPNLNIQLSIDGVGEMHDAIRACPGAFEAVEGTLRTLSEAGCRVTINTTVQRMNFLSLVAIYEYFKNTATRWHAFSLVETRVESNKETIPPDRSEDCMRELHEVWRRGEADGRPVALSEPLMAAYHVAVAYPGHYLYPGKGCTVVRRGVHISANGVALPCWHRPWDTETIQRNVNGRALDKIVDAPEVRSEIMRAVQGGCRGCSTMCYNWDPDFQRKMVNPTGRIRYERAYLNAKKYTQIHFPRAFGVARAVRRSLRSLRRAHAPS